MDYLPHSFFLCFFLSPSWQFNYLNCLLCTWTLSRKGAGGLSSTAAACYLKSLSIIQPGVATTLLTDEYLRNKRMVILCYTPLKKWLIDSSSQVPLVCQSGWLSRTSQWSASSRISLYLVRLKKQPPERFPSIKEIDSWMVSLLRPVPLFFNWWRFSSPPVFWIIIINYD